MDMTPKRKQMGKKIDNLDPIKIENFFSALKNIMKKMKGQLTKMKEIFENHVFSVQ